MSERDHLILWALVIVAALAALWADDLARTMVGFLR